MMLRPWSVLLAILALAGAGDDPGPQNRAILARLKEPIPLKFRDAPLKEVLEHVGRKAADAQGAALPISIDIGAAGTTAAARVSYETEAGEPLEEALTYLLGAHSLRFQVEEGRLRIRRSLVTLVDNRKANR